MEPEKEKDWRLFAPPKYLEKKHLIHATFVPTERWDHEHCVFCWEKFGANPDWLHSGYCEPDGRHWICEQCFQDFEELFGWVVDN